MPSGFALSQLFLVFAPFSDEDVRQISERHLGELRAQLLQRLGVHMGWTPDLPALMVRGFRPRDGVRALQRLFDNEAGVRPPAPHRHHPNTHAHTHVHARTRVNTSDGWKRVHRHDKNGLLALTHRVAKKSRGGGVSKC